MLSMCDLRKFDTYSLDDEALESNYRQIQCRKEIRDRQESEIRTRIAKERGTNQGIGVENGQTTKSFEEKE